MHGPYHCELERVPVGEPQCEGCPHLGILEVPSKLVWFAVGFQCAVLVTCILFAVLA